MRYRVPDDKETRIRPFQAGGVHRNTPGFNLLFYSLPAVTGSLERESL